MVRLDDASDKLAVVWCVGHEKTTFGNAIVSASHLLKWD
jgi:hypothetical protein